MTRLELSDTELALLDGRCEPATQVEVDAAKARLAAVAERPDLDPRHAAFVADVVSEARREGVVRWSWTYANHCGLCDTKPYGYAKYKSGPNRGRRNINKPLQYRCVDLGTSHVRGYVKLGGCGDCVESLRPLLTDLLARERCQVAPQLAAEGRPLWRRFDRRRCKECGWEGHEGEMGRDRTIMGDGWVPSFCRQVGLLARDHRLDERRLRERLLAECVLAVHRR